MNGNVVKKWESVVDSWTGASSIRNEVKFLGTVNMLLNKELSYNSIEIARECLKETKKPRSLDYKTWIQRSRETNNLILTIDEKEAKHAASDLAKKVHFPSMPINWMMSVIQLGLENSGNIDVAENYLENFESE